jgi:shikimate kinase
MKLVIIGPSGVGKSTLANYAEKEIGVKHVNLDEIFHYQGINVNWAEFKSKINTCLAKNNVLIDIGAGFYKYNQLPSFLAQLGIPIVLVYVSPEQAVSRTPWGVNRSLEEYIDTDSTKNKSLFGIANAKIDLSGLSKKLAKQQFVKFISNLGLS